MKTDPPRHTGLESHKNVDLNPGTHQVGWLVASLVLLIASISLWNGGAVASWLVVISLCVDLIAIMTAGYLLASRRSPLLLQLLLLAASCIVIGATTYLAVIQNPAYGSDEAAFSQYAAHLALQGINPYTHSMGPALTLYHTPASDRTFLLNGTPVTSFSYPALGFLLYAPLQLLGLVTQSAIATTALGWMAATVALWSLLAPPYKWAAIVVSLLGLYLGYVAAGLTDSLYLPFLLVAAYRWDQFARPGPLRPLEALGPIALGLACSVKQTPWFAAVFLVIGIAMECRHHGVAVRQRLTLYILLALGAFLVPNIVFIAAAPASWFAGVSLPLVASTLPDGQGLVSVATILSAPLNMFFYKLGSLLLTIAIYVSFALFYRRFKTLWAPLVALLLFVSIRSFSSYFLFMLPVGLVAGTTVQPIVGRANIRGRSLVLRFTAPLLLGICSVTMLVMSLIQTPPVAIRVLSDRTSGGLAGISKVTIAVANTTAVSIRPRYAVLNTNQQFEFWYSPTSGSFLGAHKRTVVTLYAPSVASMPSSTTSLQVGVVLSNSLTMASAPPATPLRTVLSPSVIAGSVVTGRPISLFVQLLRADGASLHRAGVPVSLGQTAYGPVAPVAGETSINNAPEGQSPITVATNSRGVAHFVVVGRQAQSSPVYFEAWLLQGGQRAVSYSNVVTVQFVSHRHPGQSVP